MKFPQQDQIDWFDAECIIDDWVLLGFLVGNDFVPNLPDLHISHSALPLLYKTYIKVLPTLDGKFEMLIQTENIQTTEVLLKC